MPGTWIALSSNAPSMSTDACWPDRT